MKNEKGQRTSQEDSQCFFKAGGYWGGEDTEVEDVDSAHHSSSSTAGTTFPSLAVPPASPAKKASLSAQLTTWYFF